MANQPAARTIIEEAYAARDQGNVEASVAAFHPDAVFQIAGDQTALPMVGSFIGHSSIREAMARYIDAFEFVHRDILDFIQDGDRIAVHSRLGTRFIPRDAVFTTEVVDLIELRDGKIVKFIEFADTARIRDVAAN